MKVAWISYFPVEWLPDAPEHVRKLPRQHPASWQRVLAEEMAGDPSLDLHVLVVRKQFHQNFTFHWRGIQFHCIKVPGGMRSLSLFWWETLAMRRVLKTISPDMIHAWGVERGAALAASRLNYPRLVTIQGLLRWYRQQVPGGWQQAFEASLERPSLRRARFVTTESSFGVDWLSREYPNLEIIQAEHAPGWLYHRLERAPQTRPIQFLYVGYLAAIKGSDILLQTLDRLQPELDFRLTIVGSGNPEFVASLRAQTSASLWERITQRSQLSPPEVAAEMSKATIMLFPTRADTSPNTVKEAVVCGLPVVASRVGGIVDYVKDGKNGLLCAPDNLDAFTKGIRTAVCHPAFSIGEVDLATRDQMREYLSPAQMKRLFLAAYRRVFQRVINSTVSQAKT